jgi:hypothetical protein
VEFVRPVLRASLIRGRKAGLPESTGAATCPIQHRSRVVAKVDLFLVIFKWTGNGLRVLVLSQSRIPESGRNLDYPAALAYRDSLALQDLPVPILCGRATPRLFSASLFIEHRAGYCSMISDHATSQCFPAPTGSLTIDLELVAFKLLIG